MEEAKKILQKTHGGLDVFKHYLGEDCTAQFFRNPYRKDKRASCRLYKNESGGDSYYYFLQDFGDSKFCGNCFVIVAKLLGYNLNTDFKRLLEQIDRDMKLNVFSSYDDGFHSKQVKLKKVIACGSKEKQCSISEFKPITKHFSDKELEYWQRYGIDEKTLLRYDVKSIRSCSFVKTDGKKFAIVSSELVPIYGYYFNGGLGIKFYRPKSEYRFMYAGDLPKPYIFGWNKLPTSGERVFITGGEKDVLSLAAHGFYGIAFNSETAKVPEDKLKELSERFKEIIFLYDSDETGIKESKERVEDFKNRYKVSRLQLPLEGSKKEKDISDYFAIGNSTEDFIKLINEQRT